MGQFITHLPECSRATLRQLAEDREHYRAGMASIAGSETVFERVYPRALDNWLFEETRAAARELMSHLRNFNAYQDEMFFSLN